jgi:hypothetical protein
MLQIDGRYREALEVFDRTRARLGSADWRASLTLEGAVLGAAQLDAQTADDAAKRITHLRRLAEEDPDVPPSVFGTSPTPTRSSQSPPASNSPPPSHLLAARLAPPPRHCAERHQATSSSVRPSTSRPPPVREALHAGAVGQPCTTCRWP